MSEEFIIVVSNYLRVDLEQSFPPYDGKVLSSTTLKETLFIMVFVSARQDT